MVNSMYFLSTGILFRNRIRLSEYLELSPETVRNWFRDGRMIHIHKDMIVFKVVKEYKGRKRNEGRF